METIDQNLPSVPEPLKKDLKWYIENQRDLSEKYNGKILLIVNQQLIGAFDSMQDAYGTAIKTYTLGAFTLQPCSPDPDSYTLTLYSPTHNIVA
ncbi:MAG: hypothetical protein ACRD5R_00465 [Candidatus Acidiferrales bacterium]